jgi:Arc/MetJ-type ribon-helix-helix transcriptional regulator
MDRNVLDVIEREIDDEVRTRFPGAAVRQVRLLQHGDDPQIEPRDLWVRILLDSAGPEDYDRAWKAFTAAHEPAIEELTRSLSEKVHEIMNVEFRFAESPDASGALDGPQWGYPTGQRLSDYQEWERGEATFVRAPMGPAGLETLDTLIVAGIAGTRSEAIRWAVDRFRELPAYQRIRDRVDENDALRAEFLGVGESQEPAGPGRQARTDREVLTAVEREIEAEAMARFPVGAVSRVRLLPYGDDPEIEPGDLWVRVIPAADGPDDRERALQPFFDANETVVNTFVSYLAEKLSQVRVLEFTFDIPVNRDGHCPRMSRGVSQKLSDYRREAVGEDIFELTRLGPSGLQTVDTLIMAGIADTRGEAIRRALDRIRELPGYQRLRAHVIDTERLIDEFSAVYE